ncbi:MAG: multicopper oxidase domain-containing protein [Parvibaculaceae bacterium]|nr:multicopper oxidase domain-containing protein [Parvibaculaceae bacterium]
MKVSRRTLFLSLASTAAAGLADSRFGTSEASDSKFTTSARPLKIPALDKGELQNGVRIYNLKMQKGISQFFANVETSTLGINGDYLGPTLRMVAGETVQMNVTNNIGDTSSMHWHGMHVPADQDGGPHQLIKDGDQWRAEYEVKQHASTFWYHSHVMGKTGLQVYHGLAGVIIVEDEEANGLGLPQNYGVDDIPLILQDRKFNDDGSFDYSLGMHEQMMGITGDTMLVNGTVHPYFEATSDSLRLRLLNASNSRIYEMKFSDSRHFHQIASDGGLLEKPVKMTSLTLSPGERAEIIVDLSSGKPVSLISRTPATEEFFGDMTQMREGGNEAFKLLDIIPSVQRKPVGKLPGSLARLEKVDERIAIKTRTFNLDMGTGFGMMLGREGNNMTINGKSMDMKRIDEVVKLGTSEIWHIVNPSFEAHPFHIHDVQFRILDRDGKPPIESETGLKDTVLIPSKESVRLLLSFRDYADPDTPYMYHCHNLEHEDAGMMGQFTVVT